MTLSPQRLLMALAVLVDCTAAAAYGQAGLDSLQAGVRHFQAADYDAAIPALERALSAGLESSDRVGANELLGVCYFAKGNVPKASDAFRGLLRDAPSHVLPIFFPSDVRSLFGKLKEEAAGTKSQPSGPNVESAKSIAVPPPGKPLTLSLPDFIERNFIGPTEPQKVLHVSCSGVADTLLWQIRDPWTEQRHAGADALLYVVGGEGTLRFDGRDSVLAAGSFASVPRGTTYSLTRRSRNPLIVLATLAGEPCQ